MPKWYNEKIRSLLKQHPAGVNADNALKHGSSGRERNLIESELRRFASDFPEEAWWDDNNGHGFLRSKSG